MNYKSLLVFMRFGIVGVIATALHYGVYLLLKEWAGMNLAYALGYFISFIANYILSACFTFKKKKSVKNGLGFCMAPLFNYLLQAGLLNFFVWLGISETLAPVPVYCIAVPVNFIIVRFVFNKAG